MFAHINNHVKGNTQVVGVHLGDDSIQHPSLELMKP